LKDLVNKLRSFKELKENWDSYGALPPSPATIDAAIRFIRKADRNLLPLYFAAPGPNGELVFEFRNGNREAAVYFNPEGTNELILLEQNQIRFEGSLDMNYRDLLEFMRGGISRVIIGKEAIM
jgi:hypothetical protein